MRDDLTKATRDELVSYLESWGYQCYDHESTDELREAALVNYDCEGA